MGRSLVVMQEVFKALALVVCCECGVLCCVRLCLCLNFIFLFYCTYLYLFSVMHIPICFCFRILHFCIRAMRCACVRVTWSCVVFACCLIVRCDFLYVFCFLLFFCPCIQHFVFLFSSICFCFCILLFCIRHLAFLLLSCTWPVRVTFTCVVLRVPGYCECVVFSSYYFIFFCFLLIVFLFLHSVFAFCIFVFCIVVLIATLVMCCECAERCSARLCLCVHFIFWFYFTYNLITVLSFHVLHDACTNSTSLLINVSIAAFFVVWHKTCICRTSSHMHNMNKRTRQCSRC